MVWEVLAGTLDVIFAPLAVLQPHVALLVIATFLTLTSLAINRACVNPQVVRELRRRMAEVRKNLSHAQRVGDSQRVNKFFTELLTLNNRYMKHTIKGMLISLLVIALVLPWVRMRYRGMAVARLPFSLPVIGSNLGWILWYILISFTVGWIVRKLLGW
jgi:uncharacterized membrane protein (DUF106 family)